MEFNDGQRQAIEKLNAFLNADDQHEFGLFGYAGSGKSTVIQHCFDGYTGRVLMTAPTHKAVGVLSAMAREKGLPYLAETIHRGLSLKKTYNDGEVVFVQDDRRIPMVEHFDTLVVDECSMIGTELYRLVYPYIAAGRLKVIWMGDPLQLPPVGDEEGPRSQAFDAAQSHTLTEVMRNGGVIGEAVARIRDNIEAIDPQLAFGTSDDRGQIMVMNTRRWVQRLIEEMTSSAEAADSVQALAFTNKSVDWINDRVRKAIFGQNVAPFVAGEKLVAVETFEQDGQIAFYTGETFNVIEARKGAYGYSEGGAVDCWDLIVETTSYGAKVEMSILALDEEQKGGYKKELSRLREAALKDRTKWGAFYRFKEQFANVRPGYATTIHKSQGSTYDRVYLAQSDVLKNGHFDHVLRNKLLYVGYSRTRSGLMIA